MSQAQKLLIISLGLILFVVFIATAYYVSNKRLATNSSDISLALTGTTEKPAFFTDVEGNEVSLPVTEKQTQVIYTWASWSPFSSDDLLTLNQLANNFPNVNFIALNRAETKNNVNRFLNTLSPLENIKLIIDTNDTFYLAIGGYAVPETIIYSSDGKKIAHLRGKINESEIVDALDNILIK